MLSKFGSWFSSSRRRVNILPIWVLCAALCGCESAAERHASDAVVNYYYGNYEQARVLLDPIAKQPDENFVLNNDRLGSTTLAEYRLTDAESAFLRAYEVINSVGVNNGGRSLGAALIDEKIKIWKGEPYEQAMTNFYLGLVYYIRHDYNNARAAFENSLFKLKDYGPNDSKGDQYDEEESDFALGYLMLGKAWQRLGEPDKAAKMFNEVKRLRPDMAALADVDYNQSANLLLVVDWAYGPQKRTKGDGSFVGFSPTPWQAGPIRIPHVYVDEMEIPSEPLIRAPVDLLRMAQDRKWQSIDTIRVLKSLAGTGLMAAGIAESFSNSRSNQELGAALFLGGLLLKLTSQADVRYWEMLPRTTFVIPLRVSPGPHDVTVSFGEGTRQTWRGLIAPDNGDNTYYMRMGMWSQGPYDWPPPAMGFNPGVPINPADPQ